MRDKNSTRQLVEDFHISYPVIAYIEENQSKISLCNLLLPGKPQLQLDLKKHIVHKFIGGSELFAQHQTRSLDITIAMLVTQVERPNEFWLMVLSLAAYSEKLVNNDLSQIYLACGNVPFPPHCKGARVKVAELITEVHVQDDGGKVFLYTVVLQFSNAVYACFMKSVHEQSVNFVNESADSGEYFGEQQDMRVAVKLNSNSMIKLKMIRGYN